MSELNLCLCRGYPPCFFRQEKQGGVNGTEMERDGEEQMGGKRCSGAYKK